MKGLSIGEIKENIQLLDTAVVQWLNSSPPDNIYDKLQEVRSGFERCQDLCEAPLRIAVVGEFNSGKTLLLNAMLDTTDLFPCLLQPTTGNVLETRVTLKREERAVQVKKATVVFYNDREVWETLDYFLKDLNNAGLSVPTRVKSPEELPKLEDSLMSAYPKAADISTRYNLLATLEYLMALKYNQNVALREERHSCSIPQKLLGNALTLMGRPELDKGIDFFHKALTKMHETVGTFNLNDDLKESNIRNLFPLIRRVIVDLEAWGVPFGINDPENYNPLAFLDFPGLGAESSNARDRFLCMNEIRDAHAILVVFNGANPGTSGASVMASLFQQVGKLTADRTIVAVNRFDEYHPGPGEVNNVEEYYSHQEEGTTVGFRNVIIPAKNLLPSSSKQLPLYLCSALSYLFDAKAERASWNFGSASWFNDNKRQAAYSHYKRTQVAFKKLIQEIDKTRKGGDFSTMKQSIQRYLDGAGVSSMRHDLVTYAREKGERLIKEDIIREFRAAFRSLDEITPQSTSGDGGQVAVSSEVTYRAQEFYRTLELAVADALPGGASEYKKLKIRREDKDIVLWDTIETEITSQVASWPEWFAILNQTNVKKSSPGKSQKPKKGFSRYSKIKKTVGEVPTEFKAFDDRFKNTADSLSQFALDRIGEAIVYSIQRFENHPDYQEACQALQGVMHVDKLETVEEALPLLDAWQPSRMGEEELVPEILERIADEVEDLQSIRYPYDGDKPCFWNLALIIRVQVQLVKTLRDRVSRLIAAAESQFQAFFVNEVLRAEILPLVRNCLNDTVFLAGVSSEDIDEDAEASWEAAAQSVRAALEQVRQNNSGLGTPGASSYAAPRSTMTQADVEEYAQDSEGDAEAGQDFEEW